MQGRGIQITITGEPKTGKTRACRAIEAALLAHDFFVEIVDDETQRASGRPGAPVARVATVLTSNREVGHARRA